MPQIIALNPKRKKKKAKKAKKKALKKTKQSKPAARPAKKITTKGATMPRGKKKGRKRGKKKRRANPSKVKYVTRYATQTIAGIRMWSAAKSVIPMLLGAASAKFAAKRFTEGGAEGDNWTWKNYLFGLLGGTVAAIGTSALLKRTNAAQKVFEGALLLTAYKFLTNEVAPQNPTLEAWFGEDEDIDPYEGVGQEYEEYGDIWRGEETDYVQGFDGGWRPVDESHRLPAGDEYGDITVRPDSRYGDVMVTPEARYGYIGEVDTAAAFEADGM